MSHIIVASRLPVDPAPFLASALGPGRRLLMPAAGAFSRAELGELTRDADALIVLLNQRVDEELLAAAKHLRVVANYAVGVDNIDVAAATRHKIVVANTPDVLTAASADLVFALLLATARRVVEGDGLVRSKTWPGWAPDLLLGHSVFGQTLGLIGFGRIGQAVAARARGFDMRILYHARRRVDVATERRLGARQVPLDELLRTADFVSLHCPLSPETKNLIDARALSLFKPSAILINTARGGCVDEAALCEALASGRLAGAGLDVFANEPAVPAELLRSPRVVLLPHLGSATHQARAEMVRMCATAVAMVLRGERPANVVNPEVWS